MFDSLIEAQYLRQALSDPGLILFDVRHSLSDPQSGRRDYDQGHIPGAVFLDQNNQLAGPTTGMNGRHPLPKRDHLIALLQQHGVTSDSRVIVYDQNNGAFAARAWWLLRWAGYPQVAVLNGGWQAWTAAEGHKQSASPDPAQRQVTGSDRLSSPTSDTMPTTDATAVLAASAATDMRVLIDARDPARYRGDVEPMDPVAGRIPGALNRPIRENLLPDGRFKPADALRKEFTVLLGTTPVDQVVHYCGSGITACHNIFAMELAGLTGSALYPGSWSEWCSNPQRPVAQG